MIDRLAEAGRSIIRIRSETIQERSDALGDIAQQMKREEVGSERHYKFLAAYGWLEGRDERIVVEVFGKRLPVWF